VGGVRFARVVAGPVILLVLLLANPAAGGEATLVIEEIDAAEYPQVSLTVGLGAATSPQDLTADDFVVLVEGARPEVDVYALIGDPMEVVLVIDTSGSMAGDPLNAAREGALGFINTLPDSVALGLVTFGDVPRAVAPIGTDPGEIANLLGTLAAQGETALYDAVVMAAGAFNPANDVRRVIVVLSDGGDTVSAASLDQALAAVSGQEIDVRAVALETSESDHTALARIASGSVNQVTDVGNLAAAYRDVAVELTGRFRLSFDTNAHGASEVSVYVHTPAGVLSTVRSVSFPGSSIDFGATVTTTVVTLAPPPPPSPVDVAPGTFGAEWGLPAGIGLVFVGLIALLWLASRGKAAEVPDLPFAPPNGQKKGLLAKLGSRASNLRDRLGGEEKQSRLDQDLDRAGLGLRPGEFIIIQATATVGGVVGGLVVGGPIGAVALGIIGAVTPKAVLRRVTKRRRDAFADQLEGTLQIIAGSIRSGYGLAQATATVAKESPAPTSEEFGRVSVENRLGRPVEDAMRAMATRLENEDLEWVVEAIEIQHEVGGNLAEVLDTVTGTIRDRNNIRRQVKALSAEGRVSAIILLALPFAVAGLIAVVTPDYLTELFETTIGKVMMGVAAVLMALGALWIKKLVRVEF
jgi:tight adherence protein B